MGGDFPVSHMRHEENPAAFVLKGFLQVFPPFWTIGNIIELMKQKPVKKNICEVVKLSPGAPQMEEPSTVIKKNAIKSYACGHSERKKMKNPVAINQA